jgi:hypothetical protein
MHTLILTEKPFKSHCSYDCRTLITWGDSMSISEQAKTQIIQLIDEGQSLDPLDLGEVDRWVRDSYEALNFDPVHQARFDEYCCAPWDPTPMRVCLGVWMLKQPLLGANGSLDEDILEERSIPWEHW